MITCTPERRQWTLVIMMVGLSCALCIAESKHPTCIFVGYWSASLNLVTVLLAIFGIIKPNPTVYLISAVTDFLVALACTAGAMHGLIDHARFTLAVSGLTLLMAAVLVYHGTSNLFSAQTLCCQSDVTPIMRNVAEDGAEIATTAPRMGLPPSDFMPPEDIPKLPDYEDISQKNLPPAYTIYSSPPPLFHSQTIADS